MFGLVKKGLSNKCIAEILGINHRTVDNILSCIYDKTGVKSRLDLMKW
ncbi:MAG: helix-turn-helix transcriptional regulator [Treponema sp.]|nr:helix-turn-helix transcriptional regulator [Treponema sp.]